ncbi:MAG: GNAT family N-acetyltransferase [Chloroflexi bacterium]|nr:MAG: GNAT family N-acetyltransferase [Chloroflexota bacterium]
MAQKTRTDIIVRPAVKADIPRIEAFIEPFVNEGTLLPRTYDELEQWFPNFFIAERDGEMVGCAALEVYSKKLAEIRSLAVLPEMQGSGVGRRLVQACIDLAKERDILEVMTITASEDFFKACGFDYTLPGLKKALFFQTRK